MSLPFASLFVESSSRFRFCTALRGKTHVPIVQVGRLTVQRGQLCLFVHIVQSPASTVAWSGGRPSRPASGIAPLASSTALVMGLSCHLNSVCRGQNQLPLSVTTSGLLCLFKACSQVPGQQWPGPMVAAVGLYHCIHIWCKMGSLCVE